MPVPIDSASALINALRDYRLLAEKHLDDLVRTGPAATTDPQALAQELVLRGWLTPFQVDQLFGGRGRDLVLGPYLLLEPLGTGGMGQVFKARHGPLGRVVVLKFIHPERLAHPDVVRRFRREAQAAARLSHPNIVTTHDAGEVRGQHFLAMEHLEGSDLARLLAERGPLPVEQACDFIRQAALG